MAPIPDGWTYANTGQRGIGDADNNKFYDTDEMFFGHTIPSVRIECGGGLEPEADNYWLPVMPGDWILFRAWVKAGDSTIGDTNPYDGPIIDIDLYGSSGRICGITSPSGDMYDPNTGYWPADNNVNRVNWGQDWTFTEMYFRIPEYGIADGFGSAEPPGTYVAVNGIIAALWVTAIPSLEEAHVWFAETELYINYYGPPNPIPTPTPVPWIPTPAPTVPGGIVHVIDTDIPTTNYDPFYYGNRDVALGSGFQIYCNTTHNTLGFDSEVVNSTFQIEVLSGEWNGTDVYMGITNRGGYLFFDSNSAAEIQVSHNNEKNVRLEYQNLAFSTLTPGHSWNGTIPDDTQDCYLRWSFPITLPWEEDFMLWIGLFGLALMISGLLLGAYSFKKYPIFSFDRETIWETSLLIYSFVAVFIGFGLVMTWLLS